MLSIQAVRGLPRLRAPGIVLALFPSWTSNILTIIFPQLLISCHLELICIDYFFVGFCNFWGTVCKMVRCMISDRYLSVLSVTVVYCGQTVWWIKMPLGVEVCLASPHHTVRWGPSWPLSSKMGHSPQFSAQLKFGSLPIGCFSAQLLRLWLPGLYETLSQVTLNA